MPKQCFLFFKNTYTHSGCHGEEAAAEMENHDKK